MTTHPTAGGSPTRAHPHAHARPTDPRVRPLRLPGRTRRWLWRFRAGIAAACCGLAVAAVVGELRPGPPPTAPVVVTARDLPAGTTLGERDLRVVHVDPALVPREVAADVAEHLGRRVVIAVPEGLPVVGSLLHSGGIAATAPPGTVVTTITLADPGATSVLTAGDRVDVLAAGGALDDEPGVTVLARGATVLDPGAPAQSSGGLLPGASSPGVTVLAVQAEEAATIAGFAGRSAISVVLVQ